MAFPGNQLNIIYNTKSLSDFKTEDNTYNIYLYMYDITRATSDSVDNACCESKELLVSKICVSRYKLFQKNEFFTV